jgi:hypothetical protein
MNIYETIKNHFNKKYKRGEGEMIREVEYTYESCPYREGGECGYEKFNRKDMPCHEDMVCKFIVELNI